MVNDAVAPKANCKMVAVNDGKNPHLCLFAVRDIEVWEELRFDYGVPNLPWRKVLLSISMVLFLKCFF